MEFDKLKNEVKTVPLDTLRCDADNNFEAVVLREEIEKMKARLVKFFGTPAFPSPNSLTFQMRQVIDGFGGIMPGQTLYFWNQGKEIIFAMLWPWQDGNRTTVKIIKQDNS
ncbi:MAG: hypothetical protein ABIG31_01455 [Candidatus Omnitrophota bacterium]